MTPLKVHIALNVNDLDESVQFYALQDKIWIADPNGYRWEFFVVKVADTKPEITYAAAREGATTERSCCAPECCA